MRIIDADALPVSFDGHVVSIWKKDLDNAPTIDPEDLRPKGRWDIRVYNTIPNYLWEATAECTNCRGGEHKVCEMYISGFPREDTTDKVIAVAEKKTTPYCPSCGAKMEVNNG